MLFLAMFVAATHGAPLVLGPDVGGGVKFQVGSSAGATEGHVDVFEAQLDVDARTGFFVGQAATVSTGLGPRDQRILYYALDVANFRVIRFDLVRIEGSVAELASKAGSGVLRLIGVLSIRDVASPLAVPATFTWEATSLHIQGEAAFDWATFGVPDPSVLIARVEPTVRVAFDLMGSAP